MATLTCPACGSDMRLLREQESPEGLASGVKMETHQCPADHCGRKAVVVYEPASGHSAESATWVEKEIARTGAFFPGDYTGRSQRFR